MSKGHAALPLVGGIYDEEFGQVGPTASQPIPSATGVGHVELLFTEDAAPARRYSPATGTYSDENLLQLIIAPFAVCMNLAVLWVVVVSGTITATYVAQAYVLAQIFSLPPYLLKPSGIGFLSLGPFAGGIVASVVLGIILDPTIKWLSRKNKGIYEPEYRLLAMVGGLCTGGGLMAWGYMAQNAMNVYACATVHGIVLFGVISVTIATAAYALDAYRDMSTEIFIASMVFKNFLFYSFSYFVNEWTATSGPAEVFYVFGGVAFALTLTTIPIYIFGKK